MLMVLPGPRRMRPSWESDSQVPPLLRPLRPTLLLLLGSEAQAGLRGGLHWSGTLQDTPVLRWGLSL